MLVTGAITDALVRICVDVIDAIGLLGVFVLMLLESMCIPIPSEGTMLFAGFGVADGRWSLVVLTVVGVAANVVGSWVAYGVGYLGRVDLLEKHGRKLHVKPSHLATADAWFERWGAWAVFGARMLPVVRTFISLPAGVARMPFWRFTVLTTLGCIPWVLALAFIGQQAGARWEDWKGYLHYLDYAVAAAIVAVVVWLVLRWRRDRPDVRSV